MIIEFLSFLIVFPAAVICLYPMKNQLRFRLRYTLLTMAIALVAGILLVSWAALRFRIKPNPLLFCIMVLFYLCYQYCLKVSVNKSLSVFFSVSALMSILSMFAASFDAWRNPTLGVDSYTLDYALFQLGAGVLAAALLAWPLIHYGSVVIDQLNIDRIWNWTIPFSLLLIIINLYLRPVKYETFHINRVARAVIIILVVLLILWILLHVTFYVIVTGILQAAKVQEEKRILEMQESQFISQQRYMEESARARHDFRQNIRTIWELYEARNYSSLGEFLKKYIEDLPQNEVTYFCSDHAVNALLNYYSGMAARQQIEMDIDAEALDTRLSVLDVDLCRLIGNLLENAIYACRDMEKGWIQFSARILHGNALYIFTTNSYSGEIRKSNGKYLSTRKGGKGIGLASIEAIAHQYGGTAEFSHEGGIFQANVQIPLQ